MTRAKLDPRAMEDWQIAAASEAHMKTVYQLAEEMGVEQRELLPYGHFVAKLDFIRVLERLKDRPTGKYVEVTAITPTPLGEGKSTSTMGLVQGLGRLGKRAMGTIRQPSGGPTFNIKGSAAGGGGATAGFDSSEGVAVGSLAVVIGAAGAGSRAGGGRVMT